MASYQQEFPYGYSIDSRSFPVQTPFVLRCSFVPTPFGTRSGFVREARTNEEGTEEQRLFIYVST